MTTFNAMTADPRTHIARTMKADFRYGVIVRPVRAFVWPRPTSGQLWPRGAKPLAR